MGLLKDVVKDYNRICLVSRSIHTVIGKMRYCCDDTIDAHANDCCYECTIELQRQITVMI